MQCFAQINSTGMTATRLGCAIETNCGNHSRVVGCAYSFKPLPHGSLRRNVSSEVARAQDTGATYQLSFTCMISSVLFCHLWHQQLLLPQTWGHSGPVLKALLLNFCTNNFLLYNKFSRSSAKSLFFRMAL